MNHFRDRDAGCPEGTTDKDGRFRLRTGVDREGAAPGPYVATLVWPGSGGADHLGGVFAEPDGSGLVATIDEATDELPEFAVDAAGRSPIAR